MVTLVLFHSALGLHPGVTALADALRVDGTQVVTPDLYGGRVAGTTEEGVALRDEVGITTLLARAEASLIGLPDDLVLAGASMGVAPAQLLAAQRPATRGVICLHGCAPPEALGLRAWPSIPLSVHLSPGDPWVEEDQLGFLDDLPASEVEVHRYPQTGHLFSHAGHQDHDASATTRLTERLREAVARWGAGATSG